MVFQSALNALNPVLRIWDHVQDTFRAHNGARRDEMRQRATELLRLVQLDPERVLNAYPHQLSGGMRQRVLLALGLLLDPQILILDEPTTALDILTQRAIIDVLRRLKQELGFSMIFISHDLSLAAELADRIGTMYAGRIVEQLTKFGIKTTVRMVTFTQHPIEVDEGKFQMAVRGWGCCPPASALLVLGGRVDSQYPGEGEGWWDELPAEAADLDG